MRRIVCRRVRAPHCVIDDACHTAWLRLCAHEDVALDERSAVKWLIITAIRGTWRRTSNLREVPVGGLVARGEKHELPKPGRTCTDPSKVAVARDGYDVNSQCSL